MIKKIFLLLSAILLTETRGSQINVQLLSMRVNGFSSQICDGYSIKPNSIESKLDFIYYDAKHIKWDPEKFYLLISESTSTANLALEKFGHNRFSTFINDCNLLFNRGTLEDKEKFALFILLSHIKHKIDCLLKDIESTVEPESRIPDEQFSFLFDCGQSRSRSDSGQSIASTHHISSCGEESISSDHTSITDEQSDLVLSQINLDGKSLQESSFCYYQKKIPKAPLPICLLCNLQTIKINQIEELKKALLNIDETGRLREMIFQKGSSIKFNLLFECFKEIGEKHSAENPIIIIYSTTSDSQKAYKKLSTLQGVVDGLPIMDCDKDVVRLKAESIHTCHRMRVDFLDDTRVKINQLLPQTQ
ncbi:MAG: hypothetical protein FADNKDHG_01624 [Holosporales bacterium]